MTNIDKHLALSSRTQSAKQYYQAIFEHTRDLPALEQVSFDSKQAWGDLGQTSESGRTAVAVFPVRPSSLRRRGFPRCRQVTMALLSSIEAL